MTTDVEHISKLDAAQRQLTEAILLFFERRDIIAIHSLAAAAHQILVDLSIPKGYESLLKENALLRAETKAEWRNLVNEHYNFIKHADKDAQRVFPFRATFTPFFIFDGVHMYRQLTGSLPHVLNVFLMWFNMKFPHLLRDGELKQMIEGSLAAGLDPDDFETLYMVARGMLPK